MATPEAEPVDYFDWCGEHNRQGCVHARVKDQGAAHGQTKTGLSLPTAAAAACAATRIQSWHSPMPLLPRASTHPHTHFPIFATSSASSFQPTPSSADGLLHNEAPFAGLDPSLVTVESEPLLPDHSLQVTTFEDSSTSSLPLPTSLQPPALAHPDARRSPADQQPYHHHSAWPSCGTNFKMSTSQNFAGEYTAYLNGNDDQKVFDQYIQDPDAAAQYPDAMAYNPTGQVNPTGQDHQVNPKALTGYDTASNTNLPTTRDLEEAKYQAKEIYSQYHTPNGVVTNDQKHFDAIQPLDLDNIPKSVTLHGAPSKVTYFPDPLTAEFYRFAVRPNVHKDDDTIPESLDALQSHVRVLVLAFNNVMNCQDNDAMVRPFRDRRHDQKLVECLCWQILQALIWRSQSNDPLMTAYDLSKAKDSGGLETFAERFDAVVDAMCVSKTICKHLNDAPYRMVFIDDPVKAKLRVESNRTLNKLKADQMVLGKKAQEEEAIKSGKAPANNKRKRTTTYQPTAGPANNSADGPSSPRSIMQSPQAPQTPSRLTLRHSARVAGQSPINYNQEGNPTNKSPYDEAFGSPIKEGMPVGDGQTKAERPRSIPSLSSSFTTPFGPASSGGFSSLRSPYAMSAYNPVAPRRAATPVLGPRPPGSPAPMLHQDGVRRAGSTGWNQVRSPCSELNSDTDINTAVPW